MFTTPPSATDPELASLIQEGLAHYRAGNLREAEAAYKRVLAVDPKHADALHLLGTVAFASGNLPVAVELIGRAIAAKPTAAEYWSNIAGILHLQGRFDKAATAAKQAITLRPDYVDAMHNLGRSLTALERYDEAIGVLESAARLSPASIEIMNSLGNAFMQLGRTEEGARVYAAALQLDENNVDVLSNLGLAEQLLGHLDRSAELLRRAIAGNADRVEAMNNLSVSLHRAGRLEEAMAVAQRAKERAPRDAEAYCNIGNVHKAQNDPDQAVAAYMKSIEIQPGFLKGWLNLGNALLSQARVDDAIGAYQQVLDAEPTNAIAHANQVVARLLQPNNSDAAILGYQKEWATAHLASIEPIRRKVPDQTPRRKIRVGYVSPDLRQHVVGFNVLPLFQRHNRNRFEITGYSAAAPADDRTEQFRAASDHWHETAQWSDEKLAQQIVDDRIDILVDLTLHLAGNRLGVFARRPAPVQITFAGYPGGTGVAAMGYRLTDPYLDPPGTDGAYVERSIRLPHSFWCYDPPADDPPVAPLPALANGRITFGCLNFFSKVGERTLELWAPVLRALPESQLVILAPIGSHRDRLLRRLANDGIAADRVRFETGGSRLHYLHLYDGVDIMLDTLPYCGHTTSLDALWMGVPVITRVGDTVVGRAGWSQLSNLNLSEWAALTDAQFVSIARDLAGDLPKLAAIRAGLREQMARSPLMRAAGWVAGVEAAYELLWKEFASI